jgi:proline iminopeptidase
MTASGQIQGLYPGIEPYRSGRLRVSALHEIYYEESGNPLGKPALFIHGGPGAGCSESQRRFFDPAKYRIILFEQRGCGRSTPIACLEENTTWHLVEDIERLRHHLGIDRWQVFGGSWGCALALAYAQQHPRHVTEIILRGIFLLRRHELRWFYQEGASAIFPDFWAAFVAPIPPAERDDLIAAYHRRLTGGNAEDRQAAATAWSLWEARTSYLLPNAENIARTHKAEFNLALARIECHYFVHGGFFTPETQLLDGIDKIRDIPSVIVQGRYDVVCPMMTAWDLHQAWPEADFRLIPDVGHSAFERSTIHELVSATDAFAQR